MSKIERQGIIPRPMDACLFDPDSADHQHAKTFWHADKKENGMRGLLLLDPGRRHKLWTKRMSVKTGDVVEKSDHLGWLDDVDVDRHVILDGELIVPGGTHEDVLTVMGASAGEARERQMGGIEILFKVFDVLEDGDEDLRIYGHRFRYERLLSLSITDVPEIQLVESKPEGIDVDDYLAQILELGGEGIMLKNPQGGYEDGKRPAMNWLKMKREIDFEAIVIGTKLGESGKKYSDMMGSVEIGFWDQGMVRPLCWVGIGFSDEERANGIEIGSIIKVRCFDLSHGRVPLAPRRLRGTPTLRREECTFSQLPV